jgi:hypothetical protein
LSISFIKNGSKFVSRKAEQFWMIRWSWRLVVDPM